MINVQLKDILNAMEVFKKIVNISMPARTAFKVMKVVKEVNEQCNMFDTVRKQLFEKYGVLNEDNTYNILEENISQYKEELEKLLSEKIEIIASPFDLTDIEYFDLTPLELLQINNFIEE